VGECGRGRVPSSLAVFLFYSDVEAWVYRRSYAHRSFRCQARESSPSVTRHERLESGCTWRCESETVTVH
jgi:hypothetical protein